MKTFRTYNTKLTEIEGWSTTDKKGTIEIHDENNNVAFTIVFGKVPKITVHTYDNEDFQNIIFEQKIKL